MNHRIRLRGLTSDIRGKVWESQSLLRAGRQANFEIVLDDTSVSRRHAEIRDTDDGWQVVDLGSTNGTYVNDARIPAGIGRSLRPSDIVKFGKIELAVEELEHEHIPTDPGEDSLRVEASSSSSWEEAVAGIAMDRQRCPRPGEQLLALIRAGQHLVQIEDDTEQLHSILNDAVAVLDAQRGAIVLADGSTNELKLRALATGKRHQAPGRFHYSKNLARRVFETGASIRYTSALSVEPDLVNAQSIADGGMASVLCVLLRTPRRRLGILHLDRTYWQKPFTDDDLHLADALAANVSVGIECSLLMKKQKELFSNTIALLAQAVELRDPYTGGHTTRVTNFSLLLAKRLNLPVRDLNYVRIGTPLHDVGKIGIDDAILRKPGRLTAEEFEIMKTHTVKGAHMLATEPDLAPIIPIVRSHHERWDGSGYPDGLGGEAIHFLARIVTVADTFDAMTSDRPYRRGMSADDAFSEMEKQSGRQFDPRVVAAFLDIRHRIVEEMEAKRTALLELPAL